MNTKGRSPQHQNKSQLIVKNVSVQTLSSFNNGGHKDSFATQINNGIYYSVGVMHDALCTHQSIQAIS